MLLPFCLHVKLVLCSMLDNDTLDQSVEQMFEVSGTMFAISANYLITSALLDHPKEFGKTVSGQTKPACLFREKTTIKSMKDYVFGPFQTASSSSQHLSRKASTTVTKALHHCNQSLHGVIIRVQQILPIIK